VWTLDEQNTHADPPINLLPEQCRVQDLAAGEIGNDVGEIKCRGDDGLGTELVPLLKQLCVATIGRAFGTPQPRLEGEQYEPDAGMTPRALCILWGRRPSVPPNTTRCGVRRFGRCPRPLPVKWVKVE
jgi:hypothetical protein